MKEAAACAQVAAIEFAAVCGDCDPVAMRAESFETAEGGISSLSSEEMRQADEAETSLLLAVFVTATVSLLLGCGGGLRLGMMLNNGKLPFSSRRARTSISDITISVRQWVSGWVVWVGGWVGG